MPSWTIIDDETPGPVSNARTAASTALPIARNLKLDRENDLVIEGGNLALIYDGTAVAQAVKTKLQLFQGEWFLDLEAGIPYFEEVIVKNPNLGAIQGIFRKAILEVVGIDELVDLTLSLDRATRTLSISFKATTSTGELVDQTLELLVAV